MLLFLLEKSFFDIGGEAYFVYKYIRGKINCLILILTEKEI